MLLDTRVRTMGGCTIRRRASGGLRLVEPTRIVMFNCHDCSARPPTNDLATNYWSGTDAVVDGTMEVIRRSTGANAGLVSGYALVCFHSTGPCVEKLKDTRLGNRLGYSTVCQLYMP